MLPDWGYRVRIVDCFFFRVGLIGAIRVIRHKTTLRKKRCVSMRQKSQKKKGSSFFGRFRVVEIRKVSFYKRTRRPCWRTKLNPFAFDVSHVPHSSYWVFRWSVSSELSKSFWRTLWRKSHFVLRSKCTSVSPATAKSLKSATVKNWQFLAQKLWVLRIWTYVFSIHGACLHCASRGLVNFWHFMVMNISSMYTTLSAVGLDPQSGLLYQLCLRSSPAACDLHRKLVEVRRCYWVRTNITRKATKTCKFHVFSDKKSDLKSFGKDTTT